VFHLDLTRARMLADIGVRESDAETPPLDPEDPAFLEREPARLLLRCHTRREFLAQLEPPLRRRFRKVAKQHLEDDLLRPMHKAVGNCERRGNCGDPTKWFAADVVVTGRGAVVSVSDEGAGFDVEQVVRRFASGERYFARRGQGIAHFARTSSLVSYADGGRTWLLRFLSDPEPGVPLIPDDAVASGPAADADCMRNFLARLPLFHDRGIALDACRVSSISRAPGPVEFAYVVRCRSAGQTPHAVVLTGRLLPEAAARADVELAGRLRADGVGAGRGLRIPRPIGAFSDPSLSLFLLDPTETLRARIQMIGASAAQAAVLRTVALGLAALHRSPVRPAAEQNLEEVIAQHQTAQQQLAARLPDARCRERAAACCDRLFARARRLEPCASTLVHGALEWDCIVRSARPWSLYRFDRCRLAHPGLDVGVFLADLLRFHVLRRDGIKALWPPGRAAFVEAYFGAEPPPWSKDLDWFVAGALLERLHRMMRRPEAKWAPKVVPLLDEIERTLATSP